MTELQRERLNKMTTKSKAVLLTEIEDLKTQLENAIQRGDEQFDRAENLELENLELENLELENLELENSTHDWYRVKYLVDTINSEKGRLEFGVETAQYEIDKAMDELLNFNFEG